MLSFSGWGMGKVAYRPWQVREAAFRRRARRERALTQVLAYVVAVVILVAGFCGFALATWGIERVAAWVQACCGL